MIKIVEYKSRPCLGYSASCKMMHYGDRGDRFCTSCKNWRWAKEHHNEPVEHKLGEAIAKKAQPMIIHRRSANA